MIVADWPAAMVPSSHSGTAVGCGWPTFAMEGLGVRCVYDEPWVTASETAEASLAYAAIGDLANQLLQSYVYPLVVVDRDGKAF